MTTKDFSTIYDDYAFFEAHATEASADAAGYLAQIQQLANDATPLHWLDFGCGSGGFTVRLLTMLQHPPAHLHLALVEPAAAYRQAAQAHLQAFTAHPIEAWPALPVDGSPRYDVALANHVLYYVADLAKTVAQIVASLKPAGRFFTAMTGYDNALIQIWQAGGIVLEKALPYHTAEELEQTLAQLDYPYQKQRVEYAVRFPDSEQNRLHMLRFLFADHFDDHRRGQLLGVLDPYEEAGEIIIHTHHDQYRIGPGS